MCVCGGGGIRKLYLGKVPGVDEIWPESLENQDVQRLVDAYLKYQSGIRDNSRVLERRTCLIVKSWTQEDNIGSLHTVTSLLGVWAFMGVTHQ